MIFLGNYYLLKKKTFTNIDVKAYTSGMYLLVITSNNQEIVKKVLIN